MAVDSQLLTVATQLLAAEVMHYGGPTYGPQVAAAVLLAQSLITECERHDDAIKPPPARAAVIKECIDALGEYRGRLTSGREYDGTVTLRCQNILKRLYSTGP